MTYPTHLIPTTVVGSYPQPDWLVDRAPLEQHGVPRVHAQRHLAHPGAVARAGAGRRARSSRSARWSAPASTSSPTARSAAKAIPTASRWRSTASTPSIPAEVGRSGGGTTPVPRVVGRIRRRGPVETRDAEFLLRTRDARHEDHAAGPVHPVAAGEERLLCRRGGDGDGLRRRRQRGTARAEGDRGRCRAARRTLGAHRAGEGGALGRQGDQPRARRHRRPDRSCICASATPRWCAASRPATPSCRSSPTSAAEQISIEAAQPRLDLGVLKDLSGKTDPARACSTSTIPRSRPPRPVAARLRAGLAPHRGRAAGRGPGLRHEIPAARASPSANCGRWPTAPRSSAAS